MTSARARTLGRSGYRSCRCRPGTVLLALCFWDNLVQLIFTGKHAIRSNVIDQSHAE